jgi:hypothetical protein
LSPYFRQPIAERLKQRGVGVEDVGPASEAHGHAAGDFLVEPQQPDREGAGPEIGEALIGRRAVSDTRRNNKLQIRVVAAAVSDGSLPKALPIVHRAGTGNPSRVRSPGLTE